MKGYTQKFTKKFKVTPKYCFQYIQHVKILKNKFYLELELENISENTLMLQTIEFLPKEGLQTFNFGT